MYIKVINACRHLEMDSYAIDLICLPLIYQYLSSYVTGFTKLIWIKHSLSDLHEQDSYSTHTAGEILYDEIEHHRLPGHEAWLRRPDDSRDGSRFAAPAA